MRSCLELACQILETLLSFNALDSAAECLKIGIAARVVLLVPVVCTFSFSVRVYGVWKETKPKGQSQSLYHVPTSIAPWVCCMHFPTWSLPIGHRGNMPSREDPAGTLRTLRIAHTHVHHYVQGQDVHLPMCSWSLYLNYLVKQNKATKPTCNSRSSKQNRSSVVWSLLAINNIMHCQIIINNNFNFTLNPKPARPKASYICIVFVYSIL